MACKAVAANPFNVNPLFCLRSSQKVFSVASEPSTEEYSVACKAAASNPFNVNPIFCLRSKAHLRPRPALHLLQPRQGGLVEGEGTGVLWGMPPSADA